MDFELTMEREHSLHAHAWTCKSKHGSTAVEIDRDHVNRPLGTVTIEGLRLGSLTNVVHLQLSSTVSPFVYFAVDCQ